MYIILIYKLGLVPLFPIFSHLEPADELMTPLLKTKTTSERDFFVVGKTLSVFIYTFDWLKIRFRQSIWWSAQNS